jgi:tRNA A-37 threonylcarbamoyl transferase component Bud32
MHHFKVKGNSNYKLEFNDNKVLKYALSNDDRLIVSSKKQQDFRSNYFKTPKIYEITNSSFTMEYINGDSFHDFLIRASKRDLDNFILKLDGYFKERIVGECDIPILLLKEKLKFLPQANNLLNSINQESIKIKVGLCHGDMTFSNMIFAEDIYLIDFLGVYFESPTMDILKLRQDTHLYWSLNMINNIRDEVKLKIGLEYIDEWISSTFDIEYYNLLQCINLYRIFPYTKDVKIESYLRENINKLCEHL